MPMLVHSREVEIKQLLMQYSGSQEPVRPIVNREMGMFALKRSIDESKLESKPKPVLINDLVKRHKFASTFNDN